MNDHPLKVEHHNTTSDGGSIASKDYEDRYFQDNGFDESKEVYIDGNNLEAVSYTHLRAHETR